MNKRAVFILALTIALMPFAAHAQVVGITQFATWLVGPLATPVLTIGCAALGIVWCLGRRDYEHLIHFAIGGALIGGAPTIAAMFGGGG